MASCGECGHDNTDGSRYCVNCGAEMNSCNVIDFKEEPKHHGRFDTLLHPSMYTVASAASALITACLLAYILFCRMFGAGIPTKWGPLELTETTLYDLYHREAWFISESVEASVMVLILFIIMVCAVIGIITRYGRIASCIAYIPVLAAMFTQFKCHMPIVGYVRCTMAYESYDDFYQTLFVCLVPFVFMALAGVFGYLDRKRRALGLSRSYIAVR